MGLKSDKIYFAAGVLVGVLFTAAVFSLWSPRNQPAGNLDLNQLPDTAARKTDCATKERQVVVTGTSLEPLIKTGTKVKVLDNYYACNPVKRGDIVIYNYAGNANPLIKIARGIPGDSFDFAAAAGGWNIILNKQVLQNSAKQPYILTDAAKRLLALYAADYKGVIPPDDYLILGDNPAGSLDSGNFGLVGREDLTGKVEG